MAGITAKGKDDQTMSSAKRPHIIIFNPDEMRADALHHLGNPAAVTPHLDRFAREEAVSFSSAFCQNPVCVPSRCSFFTGQYPHVNGHRTMAHLLHPEESHLLLELRRAGYHVWMNDRNDLTAGQIPGWTEEAADEIWYSGQKEPAPGPIRHPRGKPGSPLYYVHYEGELGLDAHGRNYTDDDAAVDAAIYRLTHPEDDKPMCIFLGLFYPHPPYQVEEPYFSAINRDLLKKRIREDECVNKAKILDSIRQYQNLGSLPESVWDELRSVYLGMCMKIDAQFQRLISALKTAGIYDDCAIFFLSDHGDYTGDYGVSEKCQNSFEDALVRVPLLIKPPSGVPIKPGISPVLTELVDFYATAMDLAGVTPDHTHFGHSLLPQLADPLLEHRKYVFCEGGRSAGETHCDEYHENGEKGPSPASPYWPKMMAQLDDTAHSKGIMIRDHEKKYISRTLGPDEYYDLLRDPEEKINRIDDPACAQTITALRLEMLKWLQNTADAVPFAYDQRFTPEMIKARVFPHVPRGMENHVQQMIDNGKTLPEIMQYLRSLNQDAGR